MSEVFALPASATLRVFTRTDWHVGAGVGAPGGINATVQRGQDCLPYLPGTTLTGVYRDACEQVAAALDGVEGGTWTAWVRYLFGHRTPRGSEATEPARAAVRINAGRVSAAVHDALTMVPALSAATTFIKPGVAIDPKTGRAADHEVRFVEMARAGVAMHASIEQDRELSGTQAAAASVLLVLGAAWLRGLGADRRRGSGEVAVSIVCAGAPEWSTWVTDCAHWAADHRPPPPPSEVSVIREGLAFTGSSAPGASGAGDWWEIPLTLTAREPIRVTRAVLGNLVQGEDRVPGTMLLAWVLRRLDAPDALTQALVVGDAVILDATPQVGVDAGWPVPLALHSRKSEGDGALHNVLVSPFPGGSALREGWVPGDADGVVGLPVAAVDMGLVTHNVVTVESGRPTIDDGGLYSAEVIPAGTVLRSALRLRTAAYDRVTAALGEGWPGRLAGTARLGAKSKTEYGLVEVEIDAPFELTTKGMVGDSFAVWALSDILVRDSRLRLSGRVEDVVRVLSERLGVALTIDHRQGGGGGLAVAVRSRRTESWQGSWRLPRPSLIGLAAGSCLRVRVTKGAIGRGRVADVVAGGIGERRGEGFGQVTLDAPLLAAASAARRDARVTRQAASAGPVSSDPDDGAYLEVVRRAAFVDELATQLREPAAAAARESLATAMRGTTPSQRGAVRQLIAGLRGAGWQQRLEAFLRRREKRNHFRPLVGALSELTEPDRLRFLLDPVRDKLRLTEEQMPADAGRDALGLLVLDVLAEVEADCARELSGHDHGDETTERETPPASEPGPGAPDIPAVTPGAVSHARPREKGQGGRPSGGSRSAGSAQPQPKRYRKVHARWELTCVLVARTALHAGGAHGDFYLDLTVAVDGRDRPYVPGSSLAGVLRAWWRRCRSDDRAEQLFSGRARYAAGSDPGVGEPGTFLASLVQVADAPLWGPGHEMPQLGGRDGVGIDRHTGTAAFRIKYGRQVVPAGTTFRLRLVAEQVGGDDSLGEDIEDLASSLSAHGLTVGAATSRGLGRVAVVPGTMRTHRDELVDADGMLAAIRRSVAVPDPEEVTYPAPAVVDHTPAPGVLRVSLDWRPDGPLLVGATLPGERAALMPLVDSHPDTGQPVPVLPGSSLKGVLRAEAERALRTAFPDLVATTRAADLNAGIRELGGAIPAMGVLFGTQDQRGAMAVSDLYATPPGQPMTWEQWRTYEVGEGAGPPGDGWGRESTHVAVDRWSGGAADALLFTVLEPYGLTWPPLCLEVDLTYLTSALTSESAETAVGTARKLGERRAVAAVTLLLYVVGNLTAGMVPLGRGGNRGLGAVVVDRVTLAGGEGLTESWTRQVTLSADSGSPQRRESVLAMARELCDAHDVDPATWSELLLEVEQ